MSEWRPIAEYREDEGYYVFGWWFSMPGAGASWEIADDWPDCATHFCRLPAPPAKEPSQ